MSNSFKTLLITGATGLVGRKLLEFISTQEFQIIVLTRDISRARQKLEKHPLIKFYSTEKPLEDIFIQNKIDVIVNLAAETSKTVAPSLSVKANILFPLELIHEAKKYQVNKFINLSSTFYKNESNIYSITKKSFSNILTLEKMIILNFNVDNIYGVGDNPERFVQMIVKRLMNKDKEIKLTNCNQTRDFIHVNDVAALLEKSIAKIESMDHGFYSFDLGSGKKIKVADAVKYLQELTGSFSTKLNFGAIPYDESDKQELISKIEISKTQSFFNWHPQIFIEKGFKEIVNSWKKIEV